MYEKETIGMPNDQDIIMELEKALDYNLTAAQPWRSIEVRENYAVFEGNQWDEKEYKNQVANGLPAITINRTAPVIESICGFEQQNRLDINYIPRLINAEQKNYNEGINNTVKYIEQNAKAQIQYSTAFKDMLICGVGAISTNINYDNNPDGEVEIRRVFPAFVFWDINARAKNIIDANYVVEVKVLEKEALKEAYGLDDYYDTFTSQIDARIIQFFQTVLAVESLGVVYEYQWRQKEPFYRVENPFLQLSYINPGDEEPLILLMEQMAIQFKFNPKMDNLFSVEKKDDLTKIKNMFEYFGIELKYTKQRKYKYYRAIVTGDRVIEKSLNYSQTGFSIKFMTGQFSELTQSYYGLLRGCKDPQRMLNQTVSDYISFLQTSPKGGVNIESDAVENLEAFINTYTKARNVTIFTPGALSSGKVMPKPMAPLPSGIIEMIQYADSQIMQVCGVTPELMGMMSTKEQNSGFLKQQLRQGLTTLSVYFDAKHTFMERQAELYIDCVRVLLENNPSNLMQNVIGKVGPQEIKLLESQINAEYSVIVDEVPLSPDENNETFQKLLELQTQLLQTGNNVNIMPLVLQYAPLKEDIVKQVLQLMQPPPPPPPPQPDPLNTEFMLAEIEYKRASAQKMLADANKNRIESIKSENELQFTSAKEKSDIEYINAKTISELSKAGKTNVDTTSQKFQHLTNILKT